MDTVGLCQRGLSPLVHRFESTHDFELVPYGPVGFFRQAVEHIACQQTVAIYFIASFAYFLEAVIVRDKDKCTVRIYSSDGIDELQVVLFEGESVEIYDIGVVDTDTEDDHIGMEQAEVADKVLTTQIVGYGGTVDSNGMKRKTRMTVIKINARQDELLIFSAWKDDRERVGWMRKVENKAVSS